MNLEDLGKIILMFAVILLLTGCVIYFLGKITGLEHLPGDIHYQKGNFSFYFPLGVGIIVSIVITVILNLILFFLRHR